MPVGESNTPTPLKSIAEPPRILKRESPIPADLIIVPLLIIVEVPVSTVTVKSSAKSITPPTWLLIAPCRSREPLLEKTIVPALFNRPLRSLMLVKSLNSNVALALISSSPSIEPPLKVKLPLFRLLPALNVWVPLLILNALDPVPPDAIKSVA